MAWTSPMTFIDGTVLTAAQLNTNLRDNFLETVPAKSTNNGGAGGGYFTVNGPYSLSERGLVYSDVNTTETTTATSFEDLATFGPSARVVTNTNALVFLSAEMSNSTGGANCAVTIEVSGASTIPASENEASSHGDGPNTASTPGNFVYFTDLTPGQNIFTMKYKVTDGTGSFLRRRIAVLPF